MNTTGKIAKINCILIFITCFLGLRAHSQFNYVNILDGEEKLTIPFEYEQGFIIVELALNNALPLFFIFDTGAQNTVLLEKFYAELMGLPLNEQVSIIGSDNSTVNVGYISRRVPFSFLTGGSFEADIVVLEEQKIDFNNIIGRKIDGIIGGNVLFGSVFEIDFRKQELTFYNSSSFVPPRSFYEESIEIIRQRPFISASVLVGDKQSDELKLLMDTGAGLHFLLDELSDPSIQMPDSVVDGRIGEGLGGNLGGFLGNVEKLKLLGQDFDNIPVYFQRKDTFLFEELNTNRRNGIIGNIYWQRNRVIVDYAREKLYIKPYRRKKANFRFNKSGLVIFAAGSYLEDYIIKYVSQGSAAANAGLQAGDVIVSVNNWPKQFLNLGYINKKLSGKDGESIKIVVKRKGEKLTFNFKLKSRKIKI